jgi:hypothetical protein
MSDEPDATARKPIVTLTGPAIEEGGEAWLLVGWIGSQIEIVVSEEKGADSTVLLSKDQARALSRAITTALDNPANS